MSRTYKDRKYKVNKDKPYDSGKTLLLNKEFDYLLNKKYPHKITWYWSIAKQAIMISYTKNTYIKYKDVFDKMKPYLLYNQSSVKEPRSTRAFIAVETLNNNIITKEFDEKLYSDGILQRINEDGNNIVLKYYINNNNIYYTKVYTIKGIGKIVPFKVLIPTDKEREPIMKDKKPKPLDINEIYQDYLHDKYLEQL